MSEPRGSSHTFASGAHERAAVTRALSDVRARVPGAFDRLFPLVYDELSRIAHRHLGMERTGHTLSTTALVHEAYIRLADQTRPAWADRSHFFAIAAQVMRRILVDHARRHRAARRGGPDLQSVPLEALEAMNATALTTGQRGDVLIALDDALVRLAEFDDRQARVVECRFFAGMTETETAEALGVTARTVARDWVKARGWLYQELSK